MINKEFQSIYERLVKKNEGCGIDYELLEGCFQKIVYQDFDYDYDARLDNDEILKNSYTIIARKSKQYFYKTTIIEFTKKINSFLYFWYLDRSEGVLKKVYLKNIVKEDKRCYIMGYTQVSNSLKAMNSISHTPIILKFYLELWKDILNTNAVVVMEPCGICHIDNDDLFSDTLKIENKETIKEIGKVSSQSITSEKVAIKLGMERIENLYHCSTLGPVYFGNL